METQQASKPEPVGKTYFVNTEGTEHRWHEETITVPQIRELGGWDDSQPILEVDLRDNTERTLAEDAIVELKPGHGFSKKVRFQRG